MGISAQLCASLDGVAESPERLMWENSTTLSGELRAGVVRQADTGPVAIVGSLRLVPFD